MSATARFDLKLDDGGAWKTALARELKAAGYAIDWNKVMG